MAKLETVRIKRNTGFVAINKSDFDPSIHELYIEPMKQSEIKRDVVIPKYSPPVTEAAVEPEEKDEVGREEVRDDSKDRMESNVVDDAIGEIDIKPKKELPVEDTKAKVSKSEKPEKSMRSSGSKWRNRKFE